MAGKPPSDLLTPEQRTKLGNSQKARTAAARRIVKGPYYAALLLCADQDKQAIAAVCRAVLRQWEDLCGRHENDMIYGIIAQAAHTSDHQRLKWALENIAKKGELR